MNMKQNEQNHCTRQRYRGFVLFLLLGMMIMLAACGQSGQSNPSASPGTGTGQEGTGNSSGEAGSPPSGSETENSPGNEPEEGTTPSQENQDPVQQQLDQMTLEEKVGQMILAGVQGTALDDQARRMIADQKVGGIILYANNVTTLDGTAKFVQSIKEANHSNPVPILMGVDQEGGKVSRMPDEVESIPSNGKVGKTKDEGLAEEMGTLLARQVKLAGFNLDFAPVLDVNSNPKNPVIGDRSFGSTAELVSRLGVAEMKGLRSEGIIPVVKHFPGHGDTSVDSHLELPVVNKTEQQLAKLEWIPFEAAIKEHAEAVMVAHILFPKLDPKYPASLSNVIIGEQLRGKFNYQGVVITDDLSMGAIAKNYKLDEAALASVRAGSDILLVAHSYESAKTIFDTLIGAVKKGKLDESRIDESVYRILALKQKVDLSDEGKASGDLTQLNKDIMNWRKQVEAH